MPVFSVNRMEDEELSINGGHIRLPWLRGGGELRELAQEWKRRGEV